MTGDEANLTPKDGTTFCTDKSTAAELPIAGGSLGIDANARVEYVSPTTIDLMSGLIHWAKQFSKSLMSAEPVFHSPTAVMAVRGTDFEVGYNGKVTTVWVFAGKVAVSSLTGAVIAVLNAGQKIIVGKVASKASRMSFNAATVQHWWT